MNLDLPRARIHHPDDGRSGIQIRLDFLAKVGGIVSRGDNLNREVGSALEVLIGILKAGLDDEGNSGGANGIGGEAIATSSKNAAEIVGL